MSFNDVVENPRNLVIVDSAKREKTIEIVEQVLKSEKAVTAFTSDEVTDLYRRLLKEFSGSYSVDFDEVMSFEPGVGLLELISADRFLAAILGQRAEFSYITRIALSRSSASTPSFLLVDENRSIGNEYLKKLISEISKTAPKYGIYTILVLDSLDEAELFANNAEVIL